MLTTRQYPADAMAVVVESCSFNLVSRRRVVGTFSAAGHHFVVTVRELLYCRTGKLNPAWLA